MCSERQIGVEDGARRIELRVAEIPSSLRDRYCVERTVPEWDEETRIPLSALPPDTGAFLVSLRDATGEHYWEPQGQAEWDAAELVFSRIAAGLYDGRTWRLCLHYADPIDDATASALGLASAFRVPVDQEGSEEGPQYWWVAKSRLAAGTVDFWGSLGYVARRQQVTELQGRLGTRDSRWALDRVLHTCRLVYLDWGDGEEMLVISRHITLGNVLRACRGSGVRQALRALNKLALRRKSWRTTMPPGVEEEVLADLQRQRAMGLNEVTIAP